MSDSSQFGRKASLLVMRPGSRVQTGPAVDLPPSVIDLSEMHFRFRTVQQDVESPNNCTIRIYNLSEATQRAIVKDEYTRVVLQAGYETSGIGVVFDGTIKQFRVGRENATDKYLDILAADGDLAYNFATVGVTIAGGVTNTPAQRVQMVLAEMSKKGATAGEIMQFTGGVLPRGKVLFGMARALLRNEAAAQGATWHIAQGKINILPLDRYKEGEAVVLTAQTGLVGIPEQTNEGLRAMSLLNPRLVIGGTVKIDNKSVNQLVQQNPNAAPIAFNQYTGIQNLATITADGIYRLFVVEHEGDTRGQAWYTHITGLTVNPVTKQIKPYG